MASSSRNNTDDMMDQQFDEKWDGFFDQAFENLMRQSCAPQPKPKKKRAYIDRDREEGHIRLWNDYFSEDAIYPDHIFRRRFRMNNPLFMNIVDRLSNEVPFFKQKRDATGRLGLSALQKSTTAIRMMAYGCAADAVDEYLRLVFDDVLQGKAPKVKYFVNGHQYRLAYYLTDGIYPKWATFVRSFTHPEDVERAFGVLQARFAIVKNPALIWDKNSHK
ncbi:uncharacterized protein LOC112083361 [Eutrema salsugineum]|uniref:uncharacterized protein LOC112083361 n=1 Tax=Eutrema salsugineum TaxID=72664 RepID=UPI000CED61F9|nr:uncharacterized protein LOC112083361 [Eutrema salsugineum]